MTGLAPRAWRLRRGALLGALIATVLVTAPPTSAWAVNCVQYVRFASVVRLSGDAWRWWSHAAGVYEQGSKPKTNAVLVFKRTVAMRSGHVAIVAKLVNSHTVLLNHANWAGRSGRKGQIDLGVPAIDCSRNHDWSSVCVWNAQAKVFGRPYPVSGFIYLATGQPEEARTKTKSRPSRPS